MSPHWTCPLLLRPGRSRPLAAPLPAVPLDPVDAPARPAPRPLASRSRPAGSGSAQRSSRPPAPRPSRRGCAPRRLRQARRPPARLMTLGSARASRYRHLRLCLSHCPRHPLLHQARRRCAPTRVARPARRSLPQALQETSRSRCPFRRPPRCPPRSARLAGHFRRVPKVRYRPLVRRRHRAG